VHKLREVLKEERTACITRIRGLLAEFGLVFAQSPEALRRALPDALDDASNELGTFARVTLQRGANSMSMWPGTTNASPSTGATAPMCADPAS
jgi:hypothetical protein